MATELTFSPKPSTGLRVAAVFAFIFGAMTLFSAGNVLFGPDAARQAAGEIVPFVVWFNFGAGFFYILAALGIWLGRNWAFHLSMLIAAATALTAVMFARQVMAGDGYEMRTVGALVLRVGVWAAISFAVFRARGRA